MTGRRKDWLSWSDALTRLAVIRPPRISTHVEAGLWFCERIYSGRIAFPRLRRSGSGDLAALLAYRCGGSARLAQGASLASRFTPRVLDPRDTSTRTSIAGRLGLGQPDPRDTLPETMNAPLAGLRVMELARILAGPWIGQTLADLG